MQNNYKKGDTVLFVIMSKSAYNSLLDECREYMQMGVETGGVFLGYCIEGKYFITHCVDSGKIAKRTENSFTYNSDYMEKKSNEIVKNSKDDIRLLGLWHSHWNAPAIFSTPDKKMHQKYLNLLSANIISAIVTYEDTFNINMFEIDAKNNSRLIEVCLNEIMK